MNFPRFSQSKLSVMQPATICFIKSLINIDVTRGNTSSNQENPGTIFNLLIVKLNFLRTAIIFIFCGQTSQVSSLEIV